MSLITQLALHFICKKNSKKPSFTSLVSVLGVAFGVAAFLVVVTVFNSFEKEMKHIISSINPNLIIFSPHGIPMVDDLKNEIPSLTKEPIQKTSKFIYQESIVALGRKTQSAYIRAIEGTQAAGAARIEKYLAPTGILKELNTPHPNTPHVLLGRELAKSIDAKIGSKITLMTFAQGENSPSLKYHKLLVCGFINTGISQYDSKYILMNFEDGIKLFGRKNWASGLEIAFQDPQRAIMVQEELKGKIKYEMIAWQQIDSALFNQIERDGTAIKLIVLIISFVAGFNIIVTLSLTVMDRIPHIALLRSLGAPRNLILNVFVLSGLVLGILGSILGLGCGFIILKIFSGIHLGELQKFYYLEKIPVEFNFQLALGAFLTAVCLSFIGALFPAWRASKVPPLSGLKS